MGVRDDFLNELAALRSDARKVALLLSLACVVALQVLFSVNDWNTKQWASLAELKNERRRTEAVAEAAHDTELSKQALRSANRAKEWSFQGPTLAIARLNAQQSVNAVAAETGLANAKVTLSADIDGQTDIRFFSMTIEGGFTWPVFLDFLEGLSQLDQGLIITYFAVSPGQAKQFRLIVRAPITIEIAAGEETLRP